MVWCAYEVRWCEEMVYVYQQSDEVFKVCIIIYLLIIVYHESSAYIYSSSHFA